MISRSGTRTSGASSGVIKILRDAGSGPVVTAGSVVSGLERMFMVYPPVNFYFSRCLLPSLRGALATKQSSLRLDGLLRCARHDGSDKDGAPPPPHPPPAPHPAPAARGRGRA